MDAGAHHSVGELVTHAMRRERRLRVMVIDDDATALSTMRRVLRLAGYEVHALSTPLGASREIARIGIDVVVVDVNMPAMRGERLVALFRSTPRLREIPVVLISGEESEDLQRLASSVDADAALPKTEMKHLAEAVQKASRRARTFGH